MNQKKCKFNYFQKIREPDNNKKIGLSKKQRKKQPLFREILESYGLNPDKPPKL